MRSVQSVSHTHVPAEDVEPSVVYGLQVLVGGAKLRIASVGLTAQGDLKVADGDVGTRDVVLHQSEAVAVVVGAVGAAGSVNLSLMLHEVAHEEQREAFA